MSHVGRHEISLFEYLGGFATTLREKVFCSDHWQAVCCQPIDTPEGKRVRIDLGVYPPGGEHRTAMRRCGRCAKWTPPNPGWHLCADCQFETRERSFIKRMRLLYRQTRDEEMIRTLVRRHWASPYIRSEKQDRHQPGGTKPVMAQVRARRRRGKVDEDEWFDTGVLLTDGWHARFQAPRSSIAVLSANEYQTTSGQHWLAEALDMPDVPSRRRSRSAVIQNVHDHLEWAARDSTRRAVGCSLVLLPEDEASLQDEIAEYEATAWLRKATTQWGKPERYRRFHRKPKRRKQRKKTPTEGVEVDRADGHTADQYGSSARNQYSHRASSNRQLEAG